MNKVLFLLILLFPINLIAQKYVFVNDYCIINSEITAIDFLHVTSTITKKHVEAGEAIGSIQELPDVYSKKYHNRILESETLYNKGEFIKAANTLEEAYKSEPTNLFVAEYYARALYKTDNTKCQSLEVYKKLIKQLNLEHNENQNELKIDMWHREAYWKLATLYLDIQDYESAIDLLIKFQLSISDFIGQPIYTQLLDYMTECTYYLNEWEISKKYAHNTLKYDPENSYVQGLLKKMK